MKDSMNNFYKALGEYEKALKRYQDARQSNCSPTRKKNEAVVLDDSMRFRFDQGLFCFSMESYQNSEYFDILTKYSVDILERKTKELKLKLKSEMIEIIESEQ